MLKQATLAHWLQSYIGENCRSPNVLWVDKLKGYEIEISGWREKCPLGEFLFLPLFGGGEWLKCNEALGNNKDFTIVCLFWLKDTFLVRIYKCLMYIGNNPMWCNIVTLVILFQSLAACDGTVTTVIAWIQPPAFFNLSSLHCFQIGVWSQIPNSS